MPALAGLLKRGQAYDPEQALMVAVLADALRLLTNPPSRATRAQDRYRVWRARREAAQWIRAVGRDDPFGFGSICDELELDPPTVIRALAEHCDLDRILRERPGDAHAAPQRPRRRPRARTRLSR